MKAFLFTLLFVGLGMQLRAQIRLLEYGWDVDKGHGLNTVTTVNGSGADADVNLTIPVQGLANGYHLLFVRTLDARNRWSHTYLRLVNVRAGAVPAKITQLDYTYTQAGTLVGQYAYKVPNPAATVQLTVPGDVTKLTAGQTYTLAIWATDENGTRSQVYQQAFTYRVVDCKNLAITAPATGTFCKNGSTVLSATLSGGNTPVALSWSLAGREVGKTSSLTVNQAGTYNVKATDVQGCVSSATVEVTEAPNPTVSVQTSASFCAGQSATLTAAASGGKAPYSYQWKLGTASTGSAAPTLGTSTGGTYTVTATDANGCVSTAATANVTQRPAPPATVTASAAGFTTGGSVSLTAPSGSGLTYQWLRDGQPIAGATQALYTAQQPGNYAVQVSNGDCSATSSTVAIGLITGKEEFSPETELSVSVWPNPGSDVMEVRLRAQRNKSLTVKITLSDLMGRSLYEKVVKFTSEYYDQLNLSQQPAGVYLLKTTTDKQQTMLRLIRQ